MPNIYMPEILPSSWTVEKLVKQNKFQQAAIDTINYARSSSQNVTQKIAPSIKKISVKEASKERNNNVRCVCGCKFSQHSESRPHLCSKDCEKKCRKFIAFKNTMSSSYGSNSKVRMNYHHNDDDQFLEQFLELDIQAEQPYNE